MLCEPQIINFYNKEVSLSEEQADKIFDLENKIVEQDVEISNLKLDLKSAKEYEELFNEVTSERDDIQEDLSDTIYDLQKEIERLKEENSNLQDTEKSFEIIQNITEELCDKETRIIDLEKQVKKEKELKDKYFDDKLLFSIYKDLYEDTDISNADVRIHQIMDYFDDKLDGYGDDKYRLYKRSLELHGIGENGFFDENELREEYKEIYDHFDNAEEAGRYIEDIVEWLEEHNDEQYYELNVDKPDGTRVWVKY